jgi:tagaturonate reductase
MIDDLNEKTGFNGNIAIVKPIPYGSLDALRSQGNVYSVLLRSACESELKIVRSVQDCFGACEDYEQYAKLAENPDLRFVFSNTTEAGIAFDETDQCSFAPPKSFPGKLAKFLHERWLFFKGDPSKGLAVIPCELIDNNGGALLDCVKRYASLWKLEEGFQEWLQGSCVFASTLVDRIVTGFPSTEKEAIFKELGFEDNCLVTGEKFALWVIEAKTGLDQELPFAKAGLPVIFTDDLKMYKQRKVRVLNGAHTGFALLSFLCGQDFVESSVKDPLLGRFVAELVFSEIVPTLDMPQSEAEEFARDVIERFKNPYIKHALISISLNSVSKWKTRCLPSLLKFAETYDKVPPRLAFSLASLIAFYRIEKKDGQYLGTRESGSYKVLDGDAELEFFASRTGLCAKELVAETLRNVGFFGLDLSSVNGLEELVANQLQDIFDLGARNALEKSF